jgi:hypothetical protein
MFDKCTVYTIYNRDEFCQISPSSNEVNGKNDIYYIKPFPSSLNDYHNNSKTFLTNLNYHSLNYLNERQQLVYSSSPSSSIDECSSCSISPKHLQQFSNNKKGALTKHFQFFRLTSRSCSNTLK